MNGVDKYIINIIGNVLSYVDNVYVVDAPAVVQRYRVEEVFLS